jgi:hypothetical protein
VDVAEEDGEEVLIFQQLDGSASLKAKETVDA